MEPSIVRCDLSLPLQPFNSIIVSFFLSGDQDHSMKGRHSFQVRICVALSCFGLIWFVDGGGGVYDDKDYVIHKMSAINLQTRICETRIAIPDNSSIFSCQSTMVT